MINRPWTLSLLLGTLVVASGFTDFRIRQSPEYAYTEYIPRVIDRSYGAPAIYRVLVPYANTWIGTQTGWSPALVWHLTRLAWFALAYAAIYALIRTWFSSAGSLGAVCAVAATLPLTYTNSWAHPDSIPELALFTLGCLCVVRGLDLWFVLVLIVAALNRETAAFLVAAYAFGRSLTWPHAWRTALVAGIWFAIFVGLRLWRGVEHYDYWQLTRNLEFMKLLPPVYDLYKRFYAWFLVILAGPACLIVAMNWRSVPSPARRLLATAVPTVVVALLFSSIIETRIFIPLYPLLLPAVMFALLEPKPNTGEPPRVS
jgi:hypothetical protein